MSQISNQKQEVLKNMENQNRVQQASNDKSETSLVNKDGRHGEESRNSSYNQTKNNSSDNENNSNQNKNSPYKSKTLGTIIDITR